MRRYGRCFGLLCLTLLLVVGATTGMGIALAQPSEQTDDTSPENSANSTLAQDPTNSTVRIVSPLPNQTHAGTEIVPIRLSFENTDVATLTFGNRSSPQHLAIHVTVRDADGDGEATVYLNPFQIGHGAYVPDGEHDQLDSRYESLDCEVQNIPHTDCDQIVQPDDSRNHGFHTIGNQTALVGPAGAQAVAVTPLASTIGGSKGRAVVLPQPYDLRVTSGEQSVSTTGVDSVSQLSLESKQLHDISLRTAPRTGPDAVDPSNATAVQAGIDRGVIERPGDNATVTDDQYAILAVNATGLEGALHEAALRYDPENASEILVREKQNVTEAARQAFAGPKAGLLWLNLSTTPVESFDLRLDPVKHVDRVLATTNGTAHYTRYYVFLEPRAGTEITTGQTPLVSGTRLQTVFEAGWFRDGGNYLRDDFVVSGNVTWALDSGDSDPPPAPIEDISGVISASGNVRFEAASVDAPVRRYEWQLGDGTTKSGRLVWHKYDETGEYTVNLTVYGVEQSNTTTTTITVEIEGNETGNRTETADTPTSTVTETPTNTATTTPTATGPGVEGTERVTDNTGPGFTVLIAVLVLLGLGYLTASK